MANEASRKLRWELFVLSFTALFLELTMIRWVPSVVHLVAYYANLMLLSSFLGLGLGALARNARWQAFKWFPLLLAANLGILLLCRGATAGFHSASEVRFYASEGTWLNPALLLLVFAFNALLFVPLGQRMGELFESLPRLSAYSWDLLGSLGGTLGFGWFSLHLFSPVLGVAVVMLLFLSISPLRRWLVIGPAFAATLAAMILTGEKAAIWSPYYHITISPIDNPALNVAEPPAELRTMRDPPVYIVNVNHFGYHMDGALDPARYTPDTPLAKHVAGLADQYRLPYELGPGRDRILVLGAGGGADVQAALMAGARQVDAVEIDPVVVQLSRRFNSGGPYLDPRVTVVVDDARSFVSRAPADTYDLVVFGYLDSQALFSSMSNVRLDGYIYTVESLRKSFALVNERGVLALSFATPKDWLAAKLYRMVAEATGRTPTIYRSKLGGIVLGVAKDPARVLPESFAHFRQAAIDPKAIEPSTDDWPFLYLQKKTIPADYLLGIGGLLLFSIISTGALGGGRLLRGNLHFFFLGLGFLLLETKSISDCTLYFGATWLVTLIVVAGVLLMVLAANLLAARVKAFSFGLYIPLLAALVLLLVVPREAILGLPFSARLLWALLVVPLPIFFAGLIFSAKFRETTAPSAAFGANLVGAMCGGFCEYLGMAVGHHWLSVIVIAAYVASLLALRGGRTAS